MKPKPFSSLNHFTVPVAICSLPGLLCAATREVLMQPRYERWHDLPGRSPGAMNIKCTGAFGVGVIRLGAFADYETEDDHEATIRPVAPLHGVARGVSGPACAAASRFRPCHRTERPTEHLQSARDWRCSVPRAPRPPGPGVRGCEDGSPGPG